MPQQPARCLISLSMDLHDDVMMEILVRLPAKSLIRFKSVCKKWQSLISSDHFCHDHSLRRPKLQPSLLIYTHDFYCNRGTREKYFYFNGAKTIVPYKLIESLNNNPPSAYINIAQGRNGLLLLSSTSDDEMFEYFAHDTDDHPTSFDLLYYIYNPTTRQSREIIVSRKSKYPFTAAVFLAFEPCISPFYKIVCVRLTTRPDPDSHSYGVEIEVYDSETKSWKVSMETTTDVRLSRSFRHGVVHGNNIFYCECSSSDNIYYCFDFDFAKNEMMITRLPIPQTPDHIGMGGIRIHNEQNHRYYWRYLQESNGHLYHFVRISERLNDGDGRFRSESVAVWELGRSDDDQCQWLFKYDGVLGDSDSKEDAYSIDVLRGSDGDGDGDETCSLLTFSHRKMKAYSFLDNTYEDVFHFDIDLQFHHVFQFGETLALV